MRAVMTLSPGLIPDAISALWMASAECSEDALNCWWLGQSGFLIGWNGFFLLTDPYLSDSLNDALLVCPILLVDKMQVVQHDKAKILDSAIRREHRTWPDPGRQQRPNPKPHHLAPADAD